MILSLPLSLISIILPVVFADVEFIYPSAGARIPVSVGTINVQWQDSGKAPPIGELTTYTLDLMVGGNNDEDMLQIVAFKAGGFFTNGYNVTGQIAAGIYGPVPNGFFFRMKSMDSSGGNVVNYSPRFTITGLTGSVNQTYVDAVAKLNGDTSPPPREGSAIPSGAISSSAVPSSTSNRQTVTITASRQPEGTQGHTTLAGSDQGGDNNKSVLVGVAIAVAAFVIAIVGLAVWIFMRRKRRRSIDDPFDDKNEVALSKQPSVTTLSELSTEGRVVVVEAGDGQPPPEMDSNQIRAELPGDYVYEGGDLGSGGVPLTPVASSINGEETLDPTIPLSKI